MLTEPDVGVGTPIDYENINTIELSDFSFPNFL